MSLDDLVKTLNEFFVSVNADIPPLDVNKLPAFLPANEHVPMIQPYEVCKKMLAIRIPKVQSPTNESETRPISLTSCLSKIFEDFVVTWLIYDVGDKIDPNQFGCMKGTSTTYCLLDMVHKWLLHLDSPGNHLRLCFLDYSKAFDRIGYNVLIEKLIDLGVRRSLIPWIINFLTNRRQRVKLGEATSDWLPISAGVPQGGQSLALFCFW